MTKPSDHVTGPMEPPQSDQLAALMVKYGAALHRYFVRKAGPAAADDLVQEVFLRLQGSAEKRSLEDVEGYIFTVAKRVLLNRRRSDVRRGADLHDTFDDLSEDFADDLSPERILAAKQEYSRALVAILNLPPRMRMAFVLHRFGRMSFSAIAKRMGIKKGTVQVLIQDAIKKVLKSVEGGP